MRDQTDEDVVGGGNAAAYRDTNASGEASMMVLFNQGDGSFPREGYP